LSLDVEESNVGKPSNKSAEEKARVVIAVLRGELAAVEAARLNGVSEQSIHNWKAVFLEGGRARLGERATPRPSNREAVLEAKVAELTAAIAEADVQLRTLRQGVQTLPPTQTSR
jgi:transposase